MQNLRKYYFKQPRLHHIMPVRAYLDYKCWINQIVVFTTMLHSENAYYRNILL